MKYLINKKDKVTQQMDVRLYWTLNEQLFTPLGDQLPVLLYGQSRDQLDGELYWQFEELHEQLHGRLYEQLMLLYEKITNT
jgi:hypothetical protein